jgi:hypothetical protein
LLQTTSELQSIVAQHQLLSVVCFFLGQAVASRSQLSSFFLTRRQALTLFHKLPTAIVRYYFMLMLLRFKILCGAGEAGKLMEQGQLACRRIVLRKAS